MTPSLKLLAEIKRAAKKLGISPAYLCGQAVRNAHLPGRLENGQSVTIETAETIRRYIRNTRHD